MPTLSGDVSADTRLTGFGGLETFNWGTADDLDVGEFKAAAELYRSLVKFDLSSIPTNAVVSSANLQLYDGAEDHSDNTRTMRCYRIRRAWVETEVTWNIWKTGNSWTTPGCGDTTNDREATDIGSISMPATEVLGYVTITLTNSAVQEWISGDFANNGVLLQMDTEADDGHRFWSREKNAAAHPPQFTVIYTVSVNIIPKISHPVTSIARW